LQIPRVELQEVGPYFDFELRRVQNAPEDLLKEALKRAPRSHKKQKNVSFEELDGKVGRIYMPKQDLAGLNLVKSKGMKRQRREAAADRVKKRNALHGHVPVPAAAQTV
jgi:ribosome production factor 2